MFDIFTIMINMHVKIQFKALGIKRYLPTRSINCQFYKKKEETKKINHKK